MTDVPQNQGAPVRQLTRYESIKQQLTLMQSQFAAALPPQGVAGFWQAAVLSNMAAAALFGGYLHLASKKHAARPA